MKSKNEKLYLKKLSVSILDQLQIIKIIGGNGGGDGNGETGLTSSLRCCDGPVED